MEQTKLKIELEELKKKYERDSFKFQTQYQILKQKIKILESEKQHFETKLKSEKIQFELKLKIEQNEKKYIQELMTELKSHNETLIQINKNLTSKLKQTVEDCTDVKQENFEVSEPQNIVEDQEEIIKQKNEENQLESKEENLHKIIAKEIIKPNEFIQENEKETSFEDKNNFPSPTVEEKLEKSNEQEINSFPEGYTMKHHEVSDVEIESSIEIDHKIIIENENPKENNNETSFDEILVNQSEKLNSEPTEIKWNQTTKVWISPIKITPNVQIELLKKLSVFGDINWICCNGLNDTKYNRPFAMVFFQHKKDAIDAIQAINQKYFIYQHRISTAALAKSRQRNSDWLSDKELFLKKENRDTFTFNNLHISPIKLPYSLNKLVEKFSKFGEISFARILCTVNNDESEGIALVHFENRRSAKMAILDANNTDFLQESVEITIRYAKDQSDSNDLERPPNKRERRSRSVSPVSKKRKFNSPCKYCLQGNCIKGSGCDFNH